MIIGVGVDIVEIRRIDALLHKFPNRFVTKFFTLKESQYCLSKINSANYFAKMFAIKEATIKAISHVEGVSWHNMEIRHNKEGKPIMVLSGKALENVKQRADNFDIQISTSDEKNYAIGFAIINSL